MFTYLCRCDDRMYRPLTLNVICIVHTSRNILQVSTITSSVYIIIYLLQTIDQLEIQQNAHYLTRVKPKQSSQWIILTLK